MQTLTHKNQLMLEMSVQELKNREHEIGSNLLLLDVRELHERNAANIGGVHIPMALVPAHIAELDSWRDKEVVVYCRSGARSAGVVSYLTQQGFAKVMNLRGGILAWKAAFDPHLSVN